MLAGPSAMLTKLAERAEVAAGLLLIEEQEGRRVWLRWLVLASSESGERSSEAAGEVAACSGVAALASKEASFKAEAGLFFNGAVFVVRPSCFSSLSRSALRALVSTMSPLW